MLTITYQYPGEPVQTASAEDENDASNFKVGVLAFGGTILSTVSA